MNDSEKIKAISDVLDPKWTEGKFFPAFLGAVEVARLRAIASILETFNNPWTDESKQPHCTVCGQFAYKAKIDGMFLDWRLRCVSEGEFGFEHR